MSPAIHPFAVALALLALGIITYAYRYSFLSQRGAQLAEKVPPKVLKFLGPATFSAVIANNLVHIKADPVNMKLKIIVTFFSLFVAALTKSILWTLIFGLTCLATLQFLFISSYA